MSGSIYSQASEDFKRVEEAIRFIEENFRLQPSLGQMAQAVNLSTYHFDCLFKRWAGISPVQFMRFMTIEYTKERLSASRSLLESAMDAGMSGTGRLRDLFVTLEGVTPGEFNRQGEGLRITYGFWDSPFGECLLATTKGGICYLGFVEAEGRSKALLTIPEGCAVSYQDIGAQIGHPKAVRAVGNAVAMNPVGYLIPCHRVIASTGKFNQYRWGSARKRAMIGGEAAVTEVEGVTQPG